MDPDVIVTDFEASIIEATKQHFPRARQIGCFFHFSQALWRKVQEVGLVVRYKTDLNFQLHIKTHMALAFLPSTDIHSFVTDLHSSFAASGNADSPVLIFHNYFMHTWIDGVFPISIWNQYQIDSLHRTNNVVESWHALFARQVRTVHPNIYVFMMHLKREDATAMTRIDQARLGYKTSTVSKSKYDRLHQRIQSLYDEHTSGSITSQELLNKARHVVHVFE